MILARDLKLKILNSKYPVAFTGAGVSISSGISILDSNYFGYQLSDVLTIDFFSSHIITFYKVYAEILKWTKLQPNIVHEALFKLSIPIITQNLDGLHTKAGSKDVIELHGNLNFLECENCDLKIASHKLFKKNVSENSLKETILCKNCGNILKPNLVLFGQPILKFNEAVEKIDKSDLLLVIGNSLKVWPANQLIKKAAEQKCEIVDINSNCENLFNFPI